MIYTSGSDQVFMHPETSTGIGTRRRGSDESSETSPGFR